MNNDYNKLVSIIANCESQKTTRGGVERHIAEGCESQKIIFEQIGQRDHITMVIDKYNGNPYRAMYFVEQEII